MTIGIMPRHTMLDLNPRYASKIAPLTGLLVELRDKSSLPPLISLYISRRLD